MGKTLFLFSKTFPFGSGEQYIENELPCLARHFDTIVIYPTDWFAGNSQHHRNLPPNVEVLNFNMQLSSAHIAPAGLLAYKMAVAGASRSAKELARFRQLLSVARHQWYAARNFWYYLKKKHAGEDCYLYSYWASNSCILLSMMKIKGYISRFITRAHSIDLYHYDWALAPVLKVPAFEKLKFAQADAIYPVSRHGEKFLAEKYPKYKQKVRTHWLGVSDQGINPGLPGVFTIVTCSNLSANKRLFELARALLLVEQPVMWVHFGEGEQRADIEKLANDLPSTHQILIMGQTPNEEVRRFLSGQAASVFVNLSVVEGLPVSIMEAASAGLPVIATAVYGTPEIVIDNVNGYTLPVDFTTQMLAEKITRLQEDEALQNKFRKASRENFLEHFRAEQNYEAFAAELLRYPNQIN